MQGIYFLFTGTSQHHQHMHSGTGIGGSSHAMVSSAVMEDSRSMSPSLLALLTAHASSCQVSFLGGRKGKIQFPVLINSQLRRNTLEFFSTKFGSGNFSEYSKK